MDHPCYGRKMMYAPDKTRHYIKKDEVQKYLKLGWKLSNLEMRKLNVDKNNQAYGKKWIYNPNTKETLFVKLSDIDKYFYFLAANTLTESRPEKSDVIAYAIESCKIKVPAEAVMAGDRKYDILGGKMFGLVTVGTSYGFGGREELLSAGADGIADTVDELRTLITD